MRRPPRRIALAAAGAAVALALGPVRAAEPEAARARVGVATVTFEDAAPRGPNVEERLVQIRARIQAAVVDPPLARLRRLEGEARVQFEIAPDGRAAQLALAASTGHAILDHAARAAVEAAAPLPWVYGRLEVPVRFELDSRR